MKWLDTYRGALSEYIFAEWEDGVLLCADCLQVMPLLGEKSIDLLFADPPFNVGKPYETDREDYYDWCDCWIHDAFRLLCDTGVFYLMTIPRHLYQMMRSMHNRGIFIDQIIWKTTSLNARKGQFPRMYQPILQYAKTGTFTFNPKAQIIYRDYVVPASQLKKKPELATGYPGRVCNVWDDVKFIAGGCMAPKEAVLREGSKKKVHPCQMPIALAERAILFSSNEHDIVLDPFCGIATTAIASIRTCRRFVCIDIKEDYCTAGKQRVDREYEVSEEARQLSLFSPLHNGG